MYTLFGTNGSGSAAIEVALDAMKTRYEVVRASSWEPDSALDRLRQVNPLMQIPTLQLPDGSVLTESGAILIHLGLSCPDATLIPIEPARRAQMIRGIVYIAANCYSAIGIIDYPERWCADIDDAARERIIRGTRQRLHYHWDVFADTFPATPYLSGAQPGALDFFAAMVSKWSGTRAHWRTHRPEFLKTIELIERHPLVQPVFARHWPG